jgi:hypothetical protein
MPPEIQPFNKRGLQVRLKTDYRFPHIIKAGLVMSVHHIEEPWDLPMCHKHDGSDPRDWGIRCMVPVSIIQDEEKTSGFWTGVDEVILHFGYQDLEIVEGAPVADMNRYDTVSPGPLRVFEGVRVDIFNTAGIATINIDEGDA